MFFPTLAAMLASPSLPVQVTAFGAVPNSTADATAAVAQALEAVPESGGTLEFAAGDYHFYRDHGHERTLFLSNSDVQNPRRIAILVEGRRNLRLRGNGARLVFHDRVIPLAILGSRSISVDGFEVDWQRSLMSQGVVQSADETGFTLAVDRAQYPYVVENGLRFTDKTWSRSPWGFMEFDAAHRGIAAGTGDSGFTDGDWGSAKVTEPAPGLIRFSFANRRRPAVGNVLVARHGSRDHAGAFIQDSKDVILTEVAFRHTSGLGILCQYSENLTFRGVEVAPSSRSSRLFAGHDDGLHFSNCRGRILVDGCRFEGLMDDPINVHGTAVPVVERLGPQTLRCRFAHGQSVGLKFGDAGDEISFLDPETMLSRGKGRIAAIVRRSPEEFDVTFADGLPKDLKAGDALENLTWTPSVAIRRTTFGRVRARGLLVSTPRKVVIEDNIFQSSGAAILIAGDANGWFESGAVKDVLIRKNRFENCLTSPYQFSDAVISIHPEVPKAGKTPYHRGIRIEDNDFIVFDAPVLWAKSVKGLTFSGNRIVASQVFRPWHSNRKGLTFLDCEDVQVKDNEVDSRFEGREVLVQGGRPATIAVTGWSLGR